MADAGIRPADLARESSISKGYLSSLLSGDKTEPSAKVCAKFSEVLGVSTGWLLTGEERSVLRDELPQRDPGQESDDPIQVTGRAVIARMETIERNLEATTANLAKMSDLLAEFIETFRKGPNP